MSNQPKNPSARLWVLAVNDGEAVEIVRILDSAGEAYALSGQRWGARWDRLEPPGRTASARRTSITTNTRTTIGASRSVKPRGSGLWLIAGESANLKSTEAHSNGFRDLVELGNGIRLHPHRF